VMNYRPNEEGALWLAREVWPLVRDRRPSARLRLVGAHPTRRLLRIPSTDQNISVSGAVADVRPFLWQAALAVAPLHLSRGIQNKVLEAVAAGLPTVVTSAVAAGLPVEIRNALWIADDPTTFADAIVDGLELPPAARRARATATNIEALSWESRLAPLIGILSAAGRRSSRIENRR
jgi:glycosyltransferase involved in cell wall biosynthesis